MDGRSWQERAGFPEVSDSCQKPPSPPQARTGWTERYPPRRAQRDRMARFGRFWPSLALFGPRFGRAPREQCSRDMPRPRPSCVPRGHGQQVQQRLLKPMHSQRGRAVRHSHTGRRRDGARRPSVSRTRDDAIVCQRTTHSGTTPRLAEKDPENRALGQPSATPSAVEKITTTGSEFKQENCFQSRAGGATDWPQQGPQDSVGRGS